MTDRRPSLVMVANWDSDAGYAWWLMESYWKCLSLAYSPRSRVFLAYPSISLLPPAIKDSPIECVELDFTKSDHQSLMRQLSFIREHSVKTIYFSDQPFWHHRYLLFRLMGVRCIVVHDHTPGVRPPATGLKRKLKQIIMALPGISVDAVFGATRFVSERAMRVACVPERRCYTVPNGIPLSVSTDVPDLALMFDIPKCRRIMVCVSRATHYKGISFVLRCLSTLVHEKKCDDLHFLYCGDGPDLADFKRLAAELGVEGHVTFAGRRSDVGSLLPGCHFSIQPSRGEVGYSLSILEYMRAGLPVIVPNNPSVCMATEDGVTGLIYEEDNQESAGAAILRFYRDPALTVELGSNARKSIERTFNLTCAHRALLNSMSIVDPVLCNEAWSG